MITVEDLRSEANRTGFKYVQFSEADGHSRRPYIARIFRGGTSDSGRSRSKCVWAGTRRATAEEAARDAADYLNGLEAARHVREYTPRVYDVTDPDTGRKIPLTDPEPRKPRADGPTAIYVVAFVNGPDHPLRPNRVVVIKVGTTVKKNRSKYATTLGLDVRELILPIVRPTRADAERGAEKLERAIEAEWTFVRTGEECFAPKIDMSLNYARTIIRDAFARAALAG